MGNGIEIAWETLAKMNPDEVCVRTRASFDSTMCEYTLPLFSLQTVVSSQKRMIQCNDPDDDAALLSQLGAHPSEPILGYLLHARDIPLSGNLAKPSGFSGGQIYVQGTHVLPLDSLAHTYDGNVEGFFERGIALGGEKLDYGDSSVRFCPLPRIPVVLIVWQGDDEFPPRASILFDSTAESQLPPDILWSVAKMTVQMML